VRLKFVITVLISFMASQALAQGVFDRGNGGGGIKCDDKKNQKVEVLDLYDMNQFGFQLDPAIPSDFNQALDFVIARFEESNDETNVANLQTELQAFKDEVQFVQRPLKDIDDLGIKPKLPAQCQFVQLATQWDEKSFMDRYFLINEPLWNQMNGTHQAALVVHEVFYRVILKYTKKFAASPVVIRRMVGYYFSIQYRANTPPYRFKYK